MKTFPDFMKSPKNLVDTSQQNTIDIEGYYFQGADETQIAFWECHAERSSKRIAARQLRSSRQHKTKKGNEIKWNQ